MESNIWAKVQREHGEYLLETLEPSELAYPLFQSQLISSRIHEMLMSPMMHRQQKNHELLIALQSTGQGGFDAFCTILSKRPNLSGVLEKLTGQRRDVYHVPEYSGSNYQHSSRYATCGATLETNSSTSGYTEGHGRPVEEEVGYPVPVAGFTDRGHELARPSEGKGTHSDFIATRRDNFHDYRRS